MPVSETPFLKFWRELNAELARTGAGTELARPVDAGLAWQYAGVDYRARTVAEISAEIQVMRGRRWTPVHQRTHGKDFTP